MPTNEARARWASFELQKLGPPACSPLVSNHDLSLLRFPSSSLLRVLIHSGPHPLSSRTVCRGELDLSSPSSLFVSSRERTTCRSKPALSISKLHILNSIDAVAGKRAARSDRKLPLRSTLHSIPSAHLLSRERWVGAKGIHIFVLFCCDIM